VKNIWIRIFVFETIIYSIINLKLILYFGGSVVTLFYVIKILEIFKDARILHLVTSVDNYIITSSSTEESENLYEVFTTHLE